HGLRLRGDLPRPAAASLRGGFRENGAGDAQAPQASHRETPGGKAGPPHGAEARSPGRSITGRENVRTSAMRSRAGREKRVLAVDPTSRGFGFAVLEGPDRLLDWGLVHARTDKRARTLEAVADLLERYRPDVLVL